MSRRVLGVVLAATVLAVGAFFVPAALAIRSTQRRGDLLALQREASILASRFPQSGTLDESTVSTVLDSEDRVGLYGPGGARLAGDGPATADGIVRIGLDGNFAEGYVDDDLVAVVPVRQPDTGSILAIRIEAPRSVSQARYVRSLLLLGAAAVAVVAAAGAVGLWLARRLNRPVDELRAWAESSATGAAEDPPAPTGIAELDALRTSLVDSRTRIEELLRRERSFSSQVSHQLRTPVAAMRVAVEAELAAPRSDSRAVLEESLGQLDRLESTITSLLALARHTERPEVECRLDELAGEHARRWRSALAGEGRELVVDGAPVRVRVDTDAIGHVVDVLLDNALHHGRGTVTIRVHRLDGDGVVDITDQGDGPGERDPFADTGADTSHGIGLRLARTLTESAGGRLVLAEAPTTTFRLSVPISS